MAVVDAGVSEGINKNAMLQIQLTPRILIVSRSVILYDPFKENLRDDCVAIVVWIQILRRVCSWLYFQ